MQRQHLEAERLLLNKFYTDAITQMFPNIGHYESSFA